MEQSLYNELDLKVQLTTTNDDAQKIEMTAQWILHEFDDFYSKFCEIPGLAKKAFEDRNHPESLRLSSRRLRLYSESINRLGVDLKEAFPLIANDERAWYKVERLYMKRVQGRYAADIGIAYVHSVRRKIYQGEWRPADYSFDNSSATTINFPAEIVHRFTVGEQVCVQTIEEILRIPDFSIDYGDLSGDASLVTDRINQTFIHQTDNSTHIETIEMINAGFYRNRGAYLIGRLLFDTQVMAPFIIALLNEDNGIYVDAVLNTEAETHNIFSSTLANFHVTHANYHELSVFLHSIMPHRPVGLHYSSIGYNHLGKVAVMNELKAELLNNNEVFETAIGFKGTVAIGFSSPSSAYNLKVIRNHPTAEYKWGKFEGIDSVLDKYSRVHEINRTDSMLDNIIYYNLKLNKEWFDTALLDELLREAGESVYLQDTAVIFKVLIVQRRLTPLPVFLENASYEDAKTLIVNLGYCIKNNAAANIYNKDLDARNYGVNRFLKVYLFDYDAVETFTEVKIRSNQDRIDGEEDIPDWYFEDGVIFLPEEIEVGLCMPQKALQSLFQEVHGDLLTVGYWKQIQNELRDGRVPSVSIYPESSRLVRVSQP